jgi:ankyrin repeat protein
LSVVRALSTAVASHPAVQRPRLIDAAFSGNLETLRALLAGGCDPDERGEDGTTALMTAALWGRSDAVALLLRHGADPALTDADGWTAALIAAEKGHHHIVRMLQGEQS